MKRLIPVPALVLLLACAASASAQDPFDALLAPPQNQRPRGSLESQDPRYDTPQQAVQRKAAWKAAQRRGRLEAMKRMGYSPSRPATSPLPFMGSQTNWILVPSYYPLSYVYFPRTGSSDPNVLH